MTVTRVEYEQTVWSLTKLLPEPVEEAASRFLAEMEVAVGELEAARPRLGPELTSAELLELLRTYEALTEKSFVVSAYAQLAFAADTQSEEALTFRNRMEQALIGFKNRVVFLTLWWKELSDSEAKRLLPDESQEPDFVHFLRDLRRMKPFTLEERCEQIVNLKDADGIGAVLTLYSMLTNRLEFEIEVDSETKRLTRDEAMSLVFSPQADLREAAYRESFRVFKGEAKILGQIYVNRVRDWASEQVELRGFGSPIAVRNIANDVPDRAVEVLLETGAEAASVFRRYFRWKAGQLGTAKLSRYDLYAPLSASDWRIPYADAVDQVLETLADFHPRFEELARRVFDEQHIDSEIRKGKKGGAFCATVLPSQTPWLLVNYTGRVRDVETLAHELGHAIHSMMAADHSVLTQHASLPLAETASVFAERLLADRLLAEESDPLVRRELLAASLDDIYATVVRQAYFVRFEIAAHEAILGGRSPEDLGDLYFNLLAEQFGDSVEVEEDFRYEWLSIPHIYHTPFYCYSYSFGQLLVLALYRRYQEEGESFIPGYLRILTHGGSARPETILSEAGVDMTDREFWRGGVRVLSGLVDELEAVG
ncbi:MAG: M3 family oligoendopeptidase [Acidobacteriota bacterium]|nr:M3 family oligoendopeptidase [Acidobacteriota bacterium]